MIPLHGKTFIKPDREDCTSQNSEPQDLWRLDDLIGQLELLSFIDV